nr:MAG TPA: hypothetical protein [Caudoviricetes sp.]
MRYNSNNKEVQQHTIKCYYSINYIRSFLLCQYFPSKKCTKKLCFLSNQRTYSLLGVL